MPMDDNNEGSFWDHAEVLRRLIIRALALVMGLSVVCFAVMPQLFDKVILAPCRPDFPLYRLITRIDPSGELTLGHTVNLINLELSAQFMTHMSLSLWMAVIIAFPVLTVMVWRFVAPGLYPNERHNASALIAASVIMFYVGVALGYFLIFPLALRFLADYQLSALIPNHLSLQSYMDNFFMMVLVMGLVCQLPVVACMLGRMGLITRRHLHHYRRHAIVALLVLAAVITPTGDPMTLAVVFVPLYLLLELSAIGLPASPKESSQIHPEK